MPDPDNPKIKTQLPFVLENGKFSKDTIIIAHSAGCPLTLSVLENLDVKIKKIVLVAGFATPLNGEKSDPIIQENYNWKKIRQNVEDIILINSDNDPWGCDDKQGLYMFKNLGGKLIILHGEGHMGSDKFKQPYKEFPLLEKILEL